MRTLSMTAEDESIAFESSGGLAALASIPQCALDAIPAGIVICSSDGPILRYNRHAVDLWGRSPSLGGRHERYSGALRLFHQDGRSLPHAETLMAHALSTGEPAYGREVEIERPDGSRRILLVDVEALRDDAGNVTGAINCFRDITARKDAEDDLRRSRQDLEDFFENGAVGLHLVAGDGTILRVNKAELAMLGYEADEYVGKHIADFHVDKHVIEDILSRLTAGERLDRYPARLWAKDGSIRHVVITSNGHFRDGALSNTRCFTVDVTQEHTAREALQERERRANEILDALPAAVYTTDAEGRITFFNRAAVEFSGREPELGNDNWCVTWRLYEQDGTPLPHDACPMAVCLQEGRPIRGAEAIAERPDGTRVPFIPFPTPLRDASGTLVGAVNMLVDITERKQAEEDQRTLIHELNHRVKNTLATVQAIARQTLRTTAQPRDFAEKFQGRIQALSMAHDVLTERRWADVPLGDLVERELSIFGHRSRFDLSGPVIKFPPRVALVLGMVLHELATNSVKYGALSSEAGRVRLAWSYAGGEDTSRFSLSWTESNGPPVVKPGMTGFGSRIIRRGIVGDLDGSVTMDFKHSGLEFQCDFPLESP